MIKLPRGPRLLPMTISALAALLAVKAALLASATVWPLLSTAQKPRAAASVLGEAWAAQKPQPPQPSQASQPAAKPEEPPDRKAPELAGDAAGDKPEAAVSDAERGLLLDLRARRRELDAREAALNSLAALLDAAQQRLMARVDELQSLQARLESLDEGRRARDEANWRGLVKLYESMKPAQAAGILNDLDMPVLIEVADRMKEAKAAPILAAMQPDKARALTAELARRRTQQVTPAPAGG